MRKKAMLWSVLALVLAGCGIVVDTEVPRVDPVQPRLVFKEDFSADAVGTVPANWTLSGVTPERGVIEVVEDSSLESGKAVRLATKLLAGSSQGMHINGPSTPFLKFVLV